MNLYEVVKQWDNVVNPLKFYFRNLDLRGYVNTQREASK